MSGLGIGTAGGKTSFRPGEAVQGVTSWEMEEAPQAVEVRLFWYTAGKGTVDVGIAATARFESPGFRGAQEFELTLPAAPYSFSGKLVSLCWGLEVVALPAGRSERLDLVMSPTGREVVIAGEGTPP